MKFEKLYNVYAYRTNKNGNKYGRLFSDVILESDIEKVENYLNNYFEGKPYHYEIKIDNTLPNVKYSYFDYDNNNDYFCYSFMVHKKIYSFWN